MRKTLITVCMLLLSVVLTYGLANAAVSGPCSDCHTMHDSQGGADQGQTGPQGYLTTHSCYSCHTGGASGNVNAPKIDGTAGSDGRGSGSNSLASGDVDAGGTDQDTRHDVVPLDTNVMAPPGYTTGLTWGTNNVSCDGTYGCHGKHDATSIKGMHHNGSAGYRFLYAQAGNTGGPGTAVNGVKSPTWEAGGALRTNHNVYDGDGNDSISSLCANCHGGFHGDTNTNASSPFKRHPTDEEAVIANIDGAGWTPSDTEVNETPFGFTSAQITAGMLTTDMTTGTAYTTGNGKAICLSCHRAHGTAQKDILRFNYSTMNAGNSTNNGGCETCHVAQR